MDASPTALRDRPPRGASPRWLPRSFYARAALILIVPVVTIQLAVAVMFLQRHYEDVTVQMTSNMAREIALAREHPDLADALDIDLGAPPAASRIRFWDLSARAMREQLREDFPDLVAVDTVSVRKRVALGFEDGTGMRFDRHNVSAANPHQLLVLMVATAILMTAVSFLFMRGQIRPIRRLARAAEAFGRGQHADYRPTGATEVRAAGTAFLDMRARIERHIEQRTLLLSGVSHDLRTPLTRMKLELSMMDVPQSAELAGDVEAMERIIDTFLEFARESATDERARVALKPLLRDAAEMAMPNRPVELTGPELDADIYPEGMRRAVANLVKNAGRYGDRVRVSLQSGAGAIVVAVEDDGPGIPENAYEAAMRPFSRLDDARSNTAGNVGLGLSIVRDVARAHGGALRLGRSDLGGLKAEIVVPR
ncbi:ATP-binding protein [Jannaschia sp. S6380]|uniref:ATP-binding protein n=1 Tax=Jannaschia sp. S6380 TaxID=2926408 RepID=UPI001FF68876|nr:ATP-binding protein [Jannaschia sp. S6380]MCK0166960.1 ATP-binding protein [Jannaschia sp. S6380]